MNATVLHEEVVSCNRLLRTVRASCGLLASCVAGHTPSTTASLAALDQLRVLRVPSAWLAAAFPSIKPLRSWVSEVRQRRQFLCTWMSAMQRAGTETSMSTFPYWLSGLFHPERFLLTVSQVRLCCRRALC
jgi:dynein heavy chain